MVELHIGAVFQRAHLVFHQGAVTLFFLLADTSDVVLIVDQHHQQDEHGHKQHAADTGHALQEALRIQKGRGQLDIMGAFASADGKPAQRGHDVQKLDGNDHHHHHQNLLGDVDKVKSDSGDDQNRDNHGHGGDTQIVVDAVKPLDDKIHAGDGDQGRHDGQGRPVLFFGVVDGLRQKERPQIVGNGAGGIQRYQLQGRQQDVDGLPPGHGIPQGLVNFEIVNGQDCRGQDAQHQQRQCNAEHSPLAVGFLT